MRQGHPLSSFLFVIIGEALSRILSKAEDRNLIRSFKPSQSAPIVSHLLYADDTLVFCDVEEDQIKTLVAILSKINFSKSAILGISIDKDSSSPRRHLGM